MAPNPQQTPVFFTLNKDRYNRQQTIAEIEDQTGRELLVYTTHFAHPNSSIDRSDVLGFTDLLHNVASDDIDLMLHSPGGDIDVAEKLVYMCSSRAKSLRVIVPESAKSAATLIALAANSVLMSDTSELGPIDPQITTTTAGGQQITRPATSFLDGLEAIKEEAGKSGTLSPAYFPLLSQLDPALLDFCRKSMLRSQKFAEKWLLKGQYQEQPERAKEIAERLTDTKRYLSHGTVIDYQEARDIGLAVEYLSPTDELWQLIWRLYCAYEIDMRNSGTAKLFESRTVSLPLF